MPLNPQFQTLFACHWHANACLVECAARLDEAAYKENPALPDLKK